MELWVSNYANTVIFFIGKRGNAMSKKKVFQPQFFIGDFVVVSGHQIRQEKGRHAKWIPDPINIIRYKEPKMGQVCGLRRVYDGERVYSIYGSSEPDRFIPGISRTFYLVRFGMLNKPVLCSGEQLKVHDNFKFLRYFKSPIPQLSMRKHKWTDSERKQMSGISKDWPRDEKGRWTKVGVAK